MLTPALRRRIKASLEARPLAEAEIRRLEGLGGHFLCRASLPLPDGYAEMLTFDFAGDRIAFVKWLGPGSH